MSGFTFDASIVVDALAGFEPARAEIRRATSFGSRAWISRMVWIEVLSKGSPIELRKAEAFLSGFGIDEVDAMARCLSSSFCLRDRPPALSNDERAAIPETWLAMDYDTFRDIRYRPDRSIWRGDTPFELDLFPRGGYFPYSVQVNEITDKGVKPIVFDHWQTANLVIAHQLSGFARRHFRGCRHQGPRHDVTDRTVELPSLGHDAHDNVSIGHDADGAAVVHDRNGACVLVAHDTGGVLNAVTR